MIGWASGLGTPADLYFVPVRVRVLYHHSLNVGSAHPPQTQGKVQSAVSLALSGMYRLQTEALIGFMERQTTSKLPSGIELADHGRLGKMMISIHHHLKAARRLDPLTVHGLTDRIRV